MLHIHRYVEVHEQFQTNMTITHFFFKKKRFLGQNSDPYLHQELLRHTANNETTIITIRCKCNNVTVCIENVLLHIRKVTTS